MSNPRADGLVDLCSKDYWKPCTGPSMVDHVDPAEGELCLKVHLQVLRL